MNYQRDLLEYEKVKIESDIERIQWISEYERFKIEKEIEILSSSKEVKAEYFTPIELKNVSFSSFLNKILSFWGNMKLQT